MKTRTIDTVIKFLSYLHVLQTTQNLSFHVVVLQRAAKKCSKSYNARAQPLFCSLHLLFSDVSVVVAVVIILNSLVPRTKAPCTHIRYFCIRIFFFPDTASVYKHPANADFFESRLSRVEKSKSATTPITCGRGNF